MWCLYESCVTNVTNVTDTYRRFVGQHGAVSQMGVRSLVTQEVIGMKHKPFQERFFRAVENPQYKTVVLSGPRSLGKTYIAAKVLERCMTPGDVLHESGKEYILGAASLEQARLTYQFIRAELEKVVDGDGKCAYRFSDSTTRLGIVHKASNTRLRAISSNAKTAFGLVNVPICVLDEPGALDIVGGPNACRCSIHGARQGR